MEKHPADQVMERVFERARELEKESLDQSHAFARAWLEYNIDEQWPSGWGDDLQVLIYGDFKPPEAELSIERLGITIHPEKLKNTVISSALCVLKATVTIRERSVAAITDAISRINLFLGAWTLTSWGNAGCGWWCYITHGGPGGVIAELHQKELVAVADRLFDLDPQVRRRLYAALYWVRTGQGLFKIRHDMHVHRSYAAYWNAFECLVEAISVLQPPPTLSRTERQREIDRYIQQRGGALTIGDVDELYRTYVNPGWVGKAKHALRVCFREDSDSYVRECFTRDDKENRLYDVRNAINHGEIDAENPAEWLRIASRYSMLHLMVLQMFGRLLPFAIPTNESFTNQAKASGKTP